MLATATTTEIQIPMVLVMVGLVALIAIVAIIADAAKGCAK